jgi:pyruvate dehydrogenase E2 component (dihydrolipoamide acetyltransferase)
MDMECQEEGFLAKIFIPSGEKDVNVNTVRYYSSDCKPICVLAENKEDVEKFASFAVSATAAAPSAAKPAPAAAPASAPATPSTPTASAPSAPSAGRVFASPLAKTLAAEKGIDLKTVKGTGPNGTIVKDDILNYKGTMYILVNKKKGLYQNGSDM